MRASAWILVLFCATTACDESSPPSEVGPASPADPTPTMPGQPMMPGASEQPAAPAEKPTDQPIAGQGGEQPGAQDPATPAEVPAAMDPEVSDSCAERRVSYAVPCYADPDPCGLDSGWDGDAYCLKPPAEGEGVQIHVGPKSYDDAAEVDKYLLQPNEEFNNSVLAHIPLDHDVWYDRITVQMRPGSHHWISSVVAGKPEERFYDGTDCNGAQRVGSIGGGQNLIFDNPPGGVPAPENEGLGRPLPGNSSLCMNLHAYNFADEPQLREMWINIRTVDEAAVTQRAQGIGIVGGLGLALPAGQSQTLTYTETFDKPGRIIQLFGHRHVWTPRFAVWLNERLVYDSWDWQESATFNYDSLTENPAPNPDLKVDGAVSGTLDVKAGDMLKFSCFIENESNITLRFRNELYGGEMCNLWGSAVGTGLNASRL